MTTTADLAAARTYAETNLTCPDCARTPGSRCVSLSGSGKEVTPHAARMAGVAPFKAGYTAGAASRQGEVDSLTVAGIVARADLALAVTKAATEREVAAALVADLRAQVAALTPVVVPPVKRTLFGMNVSPGAAFTGGPSESSDAAAKRLVATYGALPVAKFFYPGALPAKFNTSGEGTVPGRNVYVCFKGGIDPATITAYCASVPAGWKVTLIFWQEPDDELWVDHVFTVATYRANTQALIDAVHATPAYTDGRVRVGQCFMEYSLIVGRWTDEVVVAGADVLTFDAYFNTNAPADPSTRIKAMSAVAARFAKPWAVLEMGDRPTTFKTGADRAAFWTKVYASLAAEGAEAGVYFNALGTTGDHRVLPGTPYSDPLIAVFKTLATA